jgi:peptidoglycan/LPS O-acetylase OafA/YrhL
MTTYMSRYSIASPASLQPVATPRPVPEAWRFRPDIEGLRAIAILLVVSYHTGTVVARGGYVGVDVFFVISGFLITGQLYRELEKRGRVSLRAFYARRAIRLIPAAAVTVLATLGAAWHWLPPGTLRPMGWDALASGTYWMNVRLAVQGTDYLGAQRDVSPLQHFWSLGVEEQFYLVWPVLLVLASLISLSNWASVRSIRLMLVLVTIGSFVLCVAEAGNGSPWAYFGLPARAWELGAGALVALGVRRLVLLNAGFAAFLSWTGLVLIALSALLLSSRSSPGWDLLPPVAGAALVIIGGCAGPAGGAIKLLGKGSLQGLGALSYGWYLWHWPILLVAPYVLGHQLSLPVKIALAAGALIPAYVSLVAIENRLRLTTTVRDRPRRGLAIGAGVTAFTAAVALLTLIIPLPVVAGDAADAAEPAAPVLTDPAELHQMIVAASVATVLPAELTPSLAAAPTDYPRDGDCLVPAAEKSISYSIGMGCERRGFVAGPPAATVVLFGDSHAQHWYDALNVVAQQRKWRLVVFTKTNCDAALGEVARSATGKVPYTECDQWRDEALTRIAELRPGLVVMSGLSRGLNPLGQTGDADTNWAAAWSATVRRVESAGAEPVILQDNPFPRVNPLDCLAGHPQALRTCDLRTTEVVDRSRQRAIHRMALTNGALDIDTTPWFCTATVCPPVIDGIPVYRDTNHLTATYSKLLGGLLGKELTS